MSNGFFNVEADTRENIHPLGVICENWTFKDTFNLNILPRYDFGMDYIHDISTRDTSATKSAIDELLENIPSIKIREYTQDLKVTQCLNLIEYGIQGFKDAGEVVKGMASSAAFTRTIIDEFTNSEVYAKMFGVDTIGGNLPYPKGTDGEMLTLAYNLYYHIMGHTTTNKYELPFISKFLYETNGMDGWPSGPESGFGGTTNYSIVGKLLNLIGSNYKIVTEPIWKPVANSNGTNIELTVHLFNDTIYSAVWNYLFVNTITSHNMPL